MLVSGILRDFLKDGGRVVSVAMVDSGFSSIPAYARIYGPNPHPDHQHGNRMLSIFTAPDAAYPLSGLSLSLSCYNGGGYGALANALRALPDSDVLSISLAWRDDVPEIRDLLQSKAGRVVVPTPNNFSLPYPSSYSFTVKCCNGRNPNADYCISPRPGWKGNSYAVPAIARLMCHGDIDGCLGDIPVEEVFGGMPAGPAPAPESPPVLSSCPWCGTTLRDPKTYVLFARTPEKCPYCRRTLKQ